MRLSDVLSQADLSIYPIVGLIGFLIAFVAIAVPLLTSRGRSVAERAKMIPLRDGVQHGAQAKSDRIGGLGAEPERRA